MDYVEYLASPNPYIEGFKVGDRVRFRDGYRTNWEAELTIGSIHYIGDHSIEVIWDGYSHPHSYTKFYIASKEWWEKVAHDVSGTDNKIVPETSSRRHGHIEDYLVKGRKGQTHKYQRYVYGVSGTHKHHHIPNRQKESIETLWRSGATAKEICIALGKSSK